VVEISVETLARWRSLPNVVAVKDATGNLGRVTAQRLACGPDFCQLSGNDETALAFNAMGGVGCISVTANVAPKLCSDFQKAMREGEWARALELQDRLYPLHTSLVHRFLAGAGEICAVEGSPRLFDGSQASAGRGRRTPRSGRSTKRSSMPG
jgi:dihydrodipicolinate synthase/N-acetylneuraminate lyase